MHLNIKKVDVSKFIAMLATLILFFSIVSAAFSYASIKALDEEFLLETMDGTDFYRRADELFIKEHFNNWESMPSGQRTINFLISEINRARILRENAENFVPEVVEYVSGEDERIDITVSMEALEEELKETLGEFDTFMKILDIEIPREAEILRNLPQNMQENLHEVIKLNLIDHIRLPGKIPLDYLLVEIDLEKYLEDARNYYQQVDIILIISMALSVFLCILLFVWRRDQGLIWASFALLLSGGMVVSSAVQREMTALIFQRLTPSELALAGDFVVAAMKQVDYIGYALLSLGGIGFLGGFIYRFYRSL